MVGNAPGQQQFHYDIVGALREKLPIKLCIGTRAKGTRIRVLC